MLKFLNIFLVICVGIHARTDEELKAEFIKILMSCANTNPVDMSELVALQNHVVPTATASKCLLACAYKKEGSMNEEGMYDKEHAYKVAKKETGDNEKRYENAKKLADICAKVNDMEVSDGTKGCERSAFLFKCVVDNAPKFGFKV